ncbi:MAG: uracil-DNA glycosylase family protein [Gaiellaceae bacterium]
MPGGRASYRSLASLQRDNERCRACADAGFQLASRSVFEGRAGQRAYLFGQAPGALEGDERRPWRGRAGKTLRRWLEMDEQRFYDTFYCASITRCYPGKHPSGRGDRVPRPLEQELCSFWYEQELRLLRPRLIVPVGGMAVRRLLGAKPLAECVGASFSAVETTVIPLPHPSGASGWLNEPVNRRRLARAVEHVQAALAEPLEI